MKKFFILFAAIALVCFSVPAMAVDWNFYGSARMATYYDSRDFKDAGDGIGANLTSQPSTDDKDADLIWDLQSNSRIGAKVKADAVSGQFELGLKGTDGGDIDVGTRRIYGVWDFGPGKLKVGKDYTPVNQFISGQVFAGDLGLLGIGTMYANRPGQIALTFGGFDIAFITPKTSQLSSPVAAAVNDSINDAASTFLEDDTDAAEADFNAALGDFLDGTGSIEDVLAAKAVLAALEGGPAAIAANLPGASTGGDIDETIPKIEASWGMGFDTWNFALRGGWQWYEIEDVTSLENGDTNDIDVVSWIVGADVGFNFGPAYVKAAGSYGRNPGSAGWNIPGLATAGAFAYWDGDDDTDDTDSIMASLVAGLKVSDMLTFEAGFGWRQDDPKDAPNGLDEKSQPWAVYGQAVIALAPGVYIIPEVGYFDYDNDYADRDLGSEFYAGGKWQIDF